MDYKYTYFLIGIGFLLLWLILFFLRKDIRKEMFVMSVIYGILGLISNTLFMQDWWSPLTIDGTRIGFFDSVFAGFAIGGVTGVTYETIFNKRHDKRDRRLVKSNEHVLFFLMVPASLTIFFGGYYILGWNSLITSSFALLAPTAVVLFRRKDLIVEAFASGTILVILAAIVYNFVELLTPGWVQRFWHFQNIPPVIVFNMPLDDVFLYFLLGLFGGPLYEYWHGERLRNLKVKT